MWHPLTITWNLTVSKPVSAAVAIFLKSKVGVRSTPSLSVRSWSFLPVWQHSGECRGSRAIHKKIKEKGKATSEMKENQKEIKRKLRRLQRQQANYERETLYKEIMEAEKEDQKLFYKLVNKQRKTPQQSTNAIITEGIELTTQDEILGGWKLHFQKLATPNNENLSTDTKLEEQTTSLYNKYAETSMNQLYRYRTKRWKAPLTNWKRTKHQMPTESQQNTYNWHKKPSFHY